MVGGSVLSVELVVGFGFLVVGGLVPVGFVVVFPSVVFIVVPAVSSSVVPAASSSALGSMLSVVVSWTSEKPAPLWLAAEGEDSGTLGSAAQPPSWKTRAHTTTNIIVFFMTILSPQSSRFKYIHFAEFFQDAK